MKRRLAAISSCATIGLLGIIGVSVGIGGSASAADTTTTTASTTASTTAPTTIVPITVSTTNFSLPLFGAPLTIDVSAGPDGSLTKVLFVNPADAAAYTAVKLKPNKVAFVSDDGLSKVTITTKHGTQAVTARTSQLADIVGKGTWTGDVFGTGITNTVNYEIFANPDGSPDIINVTAPPGDPAATSTVGEVKRSSDDDRQSARVAVKFVSGLRSRSLVIRVGIGTHDGASQAKLEIALLREKGVEVPIAEAVGPHTWDGVLCGGSVAQIKFEVGTDASLTFTSVTPPTAEVKQGDNRIEVRFSDHERVRIRVKTDGTVIKVGVEPKLRCDNGAPEVNTDTSIAGESDDDHGGGDKGHDGDKDGKGHDGDKGHDRDKGSTTTTAAPAPSVAPSTTAAVTTTAAPTTTAAVTTTAAPTTTAAVTTTAAPTTTAAVTTTAAP